MSLNQELKQELVEVVAMSFETGHFSFDDFEDFKREYPKSSKEAWEYYCELVQMGPVGFYEEFKDVYDFDLMFVEEYGHYYDDQENLCNTNKVKKFLKKGFTKPVKYVIIYL